MLMVAKIIPLCMLTDVKNLRNIIQRSSKHIHGRNLIYFYFKHMREIYGVEIWVIFTASDTRQCYESNLELLAQRTKCSFTELITFHSINYKWTAILKESWIRMFLSAYKIWIQCSVSNLLSWKANCEVLCDLYGLFCKI